MMELLKQILSRFGLVAVRKGNRSLRYLRHPPRNSFQGVLLQLYPDLNGLRFVQIGANDGVRGDPLATFIEAYQWAGLRIEPLPYNFAALQANGSGNPKVKLIQAAVDTKRGKRRVYDLSPELKGLPDWTHGLASFSLDRLQQVTKELGLGEEDIRQIEVDTIAWSDIWSELGTSRCDLLVLDTEGYDITLLRACELAGHRPRIVHFEHSCVGLAERMAFYNELIQIGYEIASEGGDTTAWLPA